MKKCILCDSVLQTDDYGYLLGFHIEGGMPLHDATNFILSNDVACQGCHECGLHCEPLNTLLSAGGTFSVAEPVV